MNYRALSLSKRFYPVVLLMTLCFLPLASSAQTQLNTTLGDRSKPSSHQFSYSPSSEDMFQAIAKIGAKHDETAHPENPDLSKLISPLWIGPAFSGSWFTESRSGEGFILQILDSGEALAVWFTYPPLGSSAKQAWILAQEGKIINDRIEFTNVFRTRGPRFGNAFDPNALQIIPWGTLSFRFTDCNRGTLDYSGPSDWGVGTRDIVRLTSHAELGCSGKQKLTSKGARNMSSLTQHGGAWFDPSHSGEGWLIEELPDARAIAYWFSYDDQGEQAWTIGVGELANNRITVSENLRPSGTFFGAQFDPTAITLSNWGSLSLQFESCDSAQLNYQSNDPLFGMGSLAPSRLTKLAGAVCINGTPLAPIGGTWSRGAMMPAAQSEIATGSFNNQFYVMGGYGGARGFHRYDPGNNSWITLPSLPAGRDHAIAIANDGQIFLAGGYANGGGQQSQNGWRYTFNSASWEYIPQLPIVAASGGASLNGQLYFSSETGAIFQFDPIRFVTRRIPAHLDVSRDHSQLVAFQGELWMLGGRDESVGELTTTSIFDPASETWRYGPAMLKQRAGFAATASESHLFVAGGERIYTIVFTVPFAEVIAAGQDNWSALPNMLDAVHGVGGATSSQAFYLLGGSTLPGGIQNTGGVQIYRWP